MILKRWMGITKPWSNISHVIILHFFFFAKLYTSITFIKEKKWLLLCPFTSMLIMKLFVTCLQWNFFMRIKYVNMVIILFIQLNIQRTVAMKGKLRPQPKINLFKYQYLMRFTKCLFAPVKNDMQENRLACYLVWKKQTQCDSSCLIINKCFPTNETELSYKHTLDQYKSQCTYCFVN